MNPITKLLKEQEEEFIISGVSAIDWQPNTPYLKGETVELIREEKLFEEVNWRNFIRVLLFRHKYRTVNVKYKLKAQ